MATHIYFIRHGRTENEGNIIYGRMPGYPLSEEGRTESSAAGKILAQKNISQIYTSPLERTFQTAEIISQYCPNTRIEHVFDLNETESTGWQGLNAAELFKNNTYEEFINNPNAAIGSENLNQIASRMQVVVKQILEKNKGESVACISHEFPILALRFSLENKPLTSIKTYHMPTGAIFDFVFDDNGKFVEAVEVNA